MPMNGIEKVAERIRADAQEEANAVKLRASETAEALRREAERDARAKQEQLLHEADAEAEALYARLVAASDTEAKKSALAVKQELLNEVFAKAVGKLRTLPDAKYVALLAALAVKASETGSEQIILNPADRAKFGEAVVAEANRTSGKALTLSEETRPIVGGLILSQGRIEVNCTLDTLAAQRRSALSIEAAKLLFD